MSCAGLSNSIISNTKKNSMKKLMLIMAAALVSLSACSKSADEPVVQKTQSSESDASSVISLTIEGEREDIKVVNEDEEAARALPLTGKVTGSKISGTVFGQSGKINGLVCVYAKAPNAPVVVRQVVFTVEGKRLRYNGDLNISPYTSDQVNALLMDVYVGGDVHNVRNLRGTRNGRTNAYFFWTPKAIRTKEGMDLSQLNPIFYSYARPIAELKGGTNYASTTHSFRLFGEFLSFRFRSDMNPDPSSTTSIRFDALEVRGFGIGGLKLVEGDAYNGPQLMAKTETWDDPTAAQILRFDDGNTYRLNRANKRPLEDAAYTIYLFPYVEPKGGVRMYYTGYSGKPTDPSLEIFEQWEGRNKNNLTNAPNYWATYVQHTGIASRYIPRYPYTRRHPSNTGGTFNNLILRMSRYNADKYKYSAPAPKD